MNNMLNHIPPINALAVRRDKDDGKYQVIFKHVCVGRPLSHEVGSDEHLRAMTPNEARLLNMTYAAPLMMDNDPFELMTEQLNNVKSDKKMMHPHITRGRDKIGRRQSHPAFLRYTQHLVKQSVNKVSRLIKLWLPLWRNFFQSTEKCTFPTKLCRNSSQQL